MNKILKLLTLLVFLIPNHSYAQAYNQCAGSEIGYGVPLCARTPVASGTLTAPNITVTSLSTAGIVTNNSSGVLSTTTLPTCNGATNALISNGSTITCNTINPGSITVTTQTSSYTLVLGDAGTLIKMNSASANNLTIPLNATVAFPIGTQINIIQYGAGATSFVATAGVTIDKLSTLNMVGQYATATIQKIATDEWVLAGALQ